MAKTSLCCEMPSMCAAGGKIMLTPAEGGMFAAVELGESLCQRDGRYFMPMQFENEAIIF